ncbi:F0F1 ATP synthase subunit B [Pedobacter sp.]|nr:F0F1 ATP synthase subunit B [Candidatus Saccharibacteria bacterium]
MNALHILASETPAAQQDLLSALGINWQLLTIQIVSFLILLFVLKKLVYPSLLKALDERQASIEASAKAAKKAQVAAEKAEEATEEQLDEAKKAAADILAIAQKEAVVLLDEAETRASKKADHLIAQAEARLATDVAEARELLRTEVMGLVARATEVVIKEKLDPKKDAALIERALKESR